MKKRLHDKKAGIAILISLIIISIAEIIFRAAAMGLEAILTTANFGEQLAVIALAATILILTAKGKDRACYILYGAWIAYFVLDQLFELPGTISNLLAGSDPIMNISTALRMLTMVCIVAIGVLLVEYMSDGTIYNRAFNVLCVITLLLLAGDMFISIHGLVFAPIDILLKKHTALVLFNNFYRIVMIFLFTFFAYDSAKAQLKKTNLTK